MIAYHRLITTLVAIAPLVLAVPIVGHGIESRMALHMLLEFPMLFASGFAAFRFVQSHLVIRTREPLAVPDHLGIAGLTAASCIFAFWMIPAALDAALIDPRIAAVKYASWWIAGATTANSIQRASSEVLIFFYGNAAWMSATAGLLYVEATERLCVSYLFGDQATAGKGLIALAIAFGIFAVRAAIRNESRHAPG